MDPPAAPSASSSLQPAQPASSFLSPPTQTRPAARARASSTSTGVRPPLSLTSLSTRVCASALDPVPGTPHFPPPESPAASLNVPEPALDISKEGVQPSGLIAMFPVLLSRSFDLVRALRPSPTKHADALFESPISSPRSSIDSEYILPLSASSRKSSFDSDECTPPAPHLPVILRLPSPFPSVHAPLLLVIIMFPVSSAFVLYCLSTLPIPAEWPRTLSDLAQIGRALNIYAQAGPLETIHILTVLSVSAIWKHAWSIPGSVLWNVLAGALFHPLIATLVMTSLTTIGSLCATLLSMPLAPFLIRFFPKPIELTKAALEGRSSSSPSDSNKPEAKMDPMTVLRPTNLTASSSSSPTVVVVASAVEKDVLPNASANAGGNSAWVRLSVLRLVGIVPWSALNIACGVTGVSLRDCMAGTFIGTLPWTAVTCQVGDILHSVGATSATVDGVAMGSQSISSVLASPKIIFQLVFLSVLSLAPVLGRDWLRRFISPSEEDAKTVSSANEDELSEKVSEMKPRTSDEESDGAEYEKSYKRGRKQQRRQRWKWDRISMSIPHWSVRHLREEQRGTCI